MPTSLTNVSESELLAWIEQSLSSQTNNFAAGYQGQTLIYSDQNYRLIIKVPHGRGLLRKINVSLLRHEYQVYKKLGDFDGVPVCYGMVDEQYLVLQLVDGTTMNQQRPTDDAHYFDSMLDYLKRMHALGVAHFDLKKKTNLLVVNGNMPCFIDFGVSIIYKPGFHPFNHYLFSLAKRFDFNAWVRHKYGNRPVDINEVDLKYYDKSYIEIYSRKIKRFYKDKIKKIFSK